MKVGTFFFVIISAICLFNSVRGYPNRFNHELVAQREKMLKENTTVVGVLDNEYKEQVLQTKHGDVKLATVGYQFTFRYQVNGALYDGSIEMSSKPSSNLLKVYYLKEQPEIYSIYPQQEIQHEQANKDSWWGIIKIVGSGLFLLGASTAFYSQYKADKEKEDRIKAHKRKLRDEYRSMN